MRQHILILYYDYHSVNTISMLANSQNVIVKDSLMINVGRDYVCATSLVLLYSSRLIQLNFPC